MDMKPQTLELKRGVEILVATPGRLLDHIEAKNAVLNQVEYVVLDEADRMLDIGFLPDLQRILSYLPKQRTTLLFSATFSPEIKRLANSYLQDPVTIEVARAQRHGQHRRTALLQRGRRGQAPCAAPGAAPARHEAGLRVRQQQARLRPAGAFAWSAKA
jgi:superfamily II DNA/RNA helicase